MGNPKQSPEHLGPQLPSFLLWAPRVHLRGEWWMVLPGTPGPENTPVGLWCTFLNPQNSTQSQMHGCIFLGRRSVTLTGLCVLPKVKSHCYRCTYLYTDL